LLEANTSDGRIVQTVDIAPTLMDAVDIKPRSRFPLDGHSLLQTDMRDRMLIEYFVDAFGPTILDWASLRTDD